MPSPTALAAAAPYPIAALELCAAELSGLDETGSPGVARPGGDLLTGFQDAVRGMVAGHQAYVSFSGGRDSSAVLAVATDLCRRLGQPDPVPITLRIVGSQPADEAEWQELVVRHLGLRDWIHIDVTDELGVLGPVASRVLSRDGLLYPANAYFHELIAGHAGGGVLLTGIGGDEVLNGSYAHRHALARLGLRRRTPRIVLATAASVSARPLYVRLLARQFPRLDWLRPRAQRRLAREMVAVDPPPVLGWAAGIAPLNQTRSIVGLVRGQDLISAATGTTIRHPFLDPAFIDAAMAAGGDVGLGGRAAAMRTLTGDLLPDAVATRQTKATFEDAMWTAASLARLRSGELLDVLAGDPDLRPLLDLHALRAQWHQPMPHAHTALLAQAAHLATSATSAATGR